MGGALCSLDAAATRWTLPQPSATVRHRPREDHMAVLMISSAKEVTFGAFQRRVASFRGAGRALRDILTCFKTCQKSLCVALATLLRRFRRRVAV